MVQCIVNNCESNKTVNKSWQRRRTGITYHRFPRDASIRKQWTKALQLNKVNITDSHRVCSKHFLKQDIDRSIKSRIRLKKNAIPFASSIYSCKIKTEFDNDSQVSESEEEKFSPQKINNLGAFITKIESENTLKRSPSLIFNSPYKSFLEISVIRKKDEVIVNENKFDSKPKKFTNRATSVSPERIVTIPKVEFIPDDCQRRKNDDDDENKETKILNEKLRLARTNIVSMEKDINNLRKQIKKLQNSVANYSMTVKIY